MRCQAPCLHIFMYCISNRLGICSILLVLAWRGQLSAVSRRKGKTFDTIREAQLNARPSALHRPQRTQVTVDTTLHFFATNQPTCPYEHRKASLTNYHASHSKGTALCHLDPLMNVRAFAGSTLQESLQLPGPDVHALQR